ncbi:tryptophan-rich sensory protein [Candidatus Pacearchaeota archaeon]|nr:tryptophan-rich sensory protein [Candidatus Pacearchaeota archaeon]MBD3283082.1 tryptophan-rich sensory protein [Candidatus Pacearchaeota archaeon]
MKIKNILLLVFSILICLAAGFIGSFFTSSAIPEWYSSLNKPFFNPPNWVFAPVWTILYVLMGISLYFILVTKKQKIKRLTLFFFFIQLLLNTLWSILFFGLKNPVIAFVEILFLWGFILLTIIYTYKISRISSYLLIPYILWVSFAGILNISIILLN